MKKFKKIKLSPIVNFDEKKNQFEILLNEIGIYGTGTTKQEALNMLVDTVRASATEFFYNLELYSKTPEFQVKYPYYLSLGTCRTRSDLLKVLDGLGDDVR